MAFVVLKFGGTSVSSRERWATIAHEVRARLQEGLRPVVVCSALSGVTNALEALLEGAEQGDPGPALAQLRQRHEAFAAELGVDPGLVADDLAELERLAVGASLVGETSPKVHARVLAKGELMLTRLGAAWLRAQGLGVLWLDAREVLVADGKGPEARRFLSATVEARPDPELQALLSGPEVVLT